MLSTEETSIHRVNIRGSLQRIRHLSAFLLFCIAVPAVADGIPPKENHPILGTWAFTVPDGSCTELYNFRTNGTTLATSGEEVAESQFEIASEPSANGFYKMINKIVRDNGKKDCGGEVTEIGRTVTNFIQFHPSGEALIMCQSESLDACFGPLIRVKGQET